MVVSQKKVSNKGRVGSVVNSLNPIGIEEALATIAPVDSSEPMGPFRTDCFFCSPDGRIFFADPPDDATVDYDHSAIVNQRRQCTKITSNQFGIISFKPPTIGLKGNQLDARTQLYAVLNSAKAMVDGGLDPERIVEAESIERIGLSDGSPGVIFTGEDGMPVFSMDREGVLTLGQLGKMGPLKVPPP